MSGKTNAEVELKYSTRIVGLNLGIVGVWPISSATPFFSNTLQNIQRVFTYCLLFLTIVPGLLYIYLIETNNKVKLRHLAPLMNCGMQFFKYTILLGRTKEITKGLEMVKQDWMNATEENRQIFRSKATLGRRMMLIVTFTMYGGGLCYRIILPLLRGATVTPSNVTIRPVPCPSYFIILNEQVTPNYEIIFVLQIFAGFVTYAVLSGSCGICALLVLHTCSMLRILVNKMRQLVDKTDMNEAVIRRRIMDIVEYQTKIGKFLKNSKKVVEYICLTEMLGGTCLVCLVGYCILMELENNNTTAIVIYMTLYISCTLCIFILCYIGQLLLDENTILNKTCCTVNWYRLPTKHARCLILITAMSNYPMKLTAGKILGMSLTSFTDVMKISVGYLNMLREVL